MTQETVIDLERVKAEFAKEKWKLLLGPPNPDTKMYVGGVVAAARSPKLVIEVVP